MVKFGLWANLLVTISCAIEGDVFFYITIVQASFVFDEVLAIPTTLDLF
jgi:hypothetical protein